MATFKTCIFKNHLRKDGTYNVKLRVTHKRVTRKISTPYYVDAKYVTSEFEIIDKELLDLCEDLCADCRKICRDLAYIIHSGFISGYQNRYGDNLKPPTNVYHRMTA